MDSAGNYLLLKVGILRRETTQERLSPCSEWGNLACGMIELLQIQTASINRWETACKNKGLLYKDFTVVTSADWTYSIEIMLHGDDTSSEDNWVFGEEKMKAAYQTSLSFSQEFTRIQSKLSINSKHEKIQYRNKYLWKAFPGKNLKPNNAWKIYKHKSGWKYFSSFEGTTVIQTV